MRVSPSSPLIPRGSLLTQKVLNDLKKARLSRLPPSPLSRQKARPATHRKTEKERQNLLTGEGRRGWARSRIMRPQDSLRLYRPFNTLCAYPRHPTLLSPGAHSYPMHPAVIPHLPSPTTLYGFLNWFTVCMYVYVETKIFSPGRITLAAIDTAQSGRPL
jgi:hypothetical protein